MKAQKYYTLAGKSAAESYQNQQAIDYLTRALAFTPFADLDTQFEIISARAELFNRQADRVSQRKDLEALENLAQQMGNSTLRAKMLMLRTVYFYMVGNYQDAIQDASGSEAFSDPIANADLAFLAQTTWFLALFRLGRFGEAMLRAQNTLERVRAAGNRREEARVLNAMGLIALEQKAPGIAERYLIQALEIARDIKDRSIESRAVGNLAIYETHIRNNYALAYQYHLQNYEIAREIGDRNAEGVALGNLGFIAGLQGDFKSAYRYHEYSLLLARETGNRYHETYILINLSSLTGMQNNAELALQYAQEAAGIARKSGERSGEAWAMFYMGHAYLLRNELEQARLAFQGSLEIRNDLDQPSIAMEPVAGLVEVALRMDNLEAASREAEKILGHLEKGGTLDGVDEPLRVYYACYLFLKNNQDPRSEQILQTAMDLLEAQVSKFSDEQTRKMYIENVPWRLAIHRAARVVNP